MIIADVLHNEPIVGDAVLIECGDTLLETVVVDLTEDGVVIQLDEQSMQLLSESTIWGSLFGHFDKKAGNDALKSAGYLVGVYHQSEKSWDKISSVLGPEKMKTLNRALRLVQDTPGWRENPYFREGAIEGISAVKNNDSALEGMIRSKYNRIAASMDYLAEGWRTNLGALGAAGILGAGAVLSPSAYVKGEQYYYSDNPPPAGTQTKVVVDDRGRKIIVWTVKKHSGKEQYYYDPNTRAVKESVLRFNTVELTESNVADYVQHYYRAYNIDRAPQQSISNFKKNNRLNESSDSELDEFISAIKSTDSVKRVAVGDKFAVLAFEINPAWKEIEVYGFAEPKEITRIVKHSDGRINFIEFADGDRYPRITQATHNSKPFMQTAYFGSADEIERALSAILLVKPESYSINFSEYGAAHKLDEAEYRGRKVPLGKPMKGDVKKSKVYVKKPNGTVVKVNFGDKNMRIKKSNTKRRKSFRARHNCANPGPRWKARYWSCRAW